MKAKKTEERALLFVCDKGFIYFGYSACKLDATDALVRRPRQVVYYSKDCRGLLGLVAGGPTENCCITTSTPEGHLHEIIQIFPVGARAAEAFEEGPWKE